MAMDSDLIKTVNKLQDTFHNLGGELDMPQLVVVGSQSAGKSSVLETIVGKDFLPRGSGIVTRRPLVLQLIHTPAPPNSQDSTPTEWAQFLHLDKRFTDFNEIRKEIEQETFRVAGQNKGISKLPISLRIYSPNVLDLTLVDLPGLTKIPVGDQPSDIEKQIRNLVLDYISKPNSVILAVSPANVDLANSESLKLARSVDPQGRRTIGVLTKLDLMDAGTNALDILTGRVYPLKLGFIGVVNRSQQDINSEKPMEDALKSEQEFFNNHPAYRTIAHKNGTRYLAKTLNQVLMNHIREKLPDMKARLNTLITQAESQLLSYGTPLSSLSPTSTSSSTTIQTHQSTLILRLMTQFARDFISSIDGTSLSSSTNTKELSGGARIYYIFNDVFGSALSSIDATAGLGDGDIRTVIRNSTGPRPSLFVPEVAFELLVKPQIRRLEGPSLRCVEMVYEELVKICHGCTSPELARFPRLHAQLVEVVSELLRERLGPTSEYTKSLIDIQSAYINTNHPAFVAGSGSALVQQGQTKPRPALEPTTTNGVIPGAHHDEDASSSDISDDDDTPSKGDDLFPPPNAKDRSVSNTLHDRTSRSGRASTGSTLTPTAPVNIASGKRSSSKQPQRPHSALGVGAGAGGVGGGSPPSATARETFLGYFFGQNGPGAEKHHHAHHQHQGIVPTGRDTSGAGTEMTGLLADKRSNPAYDMKSLGRHIEAIPATPHHHANNNHTNHLSARESLETSLIRSLITSYFAIVRQTILDLVPKAIMHLLVNWTSEHVQNRLVEVLYKPEKFGEMLDEDEELVRERERVKALLDAYKEAFGVLGEVGVGGVGVGGVGRGV